MKEKVLVRSSKRRLNTEYGKEFAYVLKACGIKERDFFSECYGMNHDLAARTHLAKVVMADFLRSRGLASVQISLLMFASYWSVNSYRHEAERMARENRRFVNMRKVLDDLNRKKNIL